MLELIDRIVFRVGRNILLSMRKFHIGSVMQLKIRSWFYRLLQNPVWCIAHYENELLNTASPIISKNNSQKCCDVLVWAVKASGMRPQMIFGSLAAALACQGKNVKIVLCDGVMSACNRLHSMPGLPKSKWKELCPKCFSGPSSFFHYLGLDVKIISELLPAGYAENLRLKVDSLTTEEMLEMCYLDVPVYHYVEDSLLRHFGASKYIDMASKDLMRREYTFSALMMIDAVKSFTEKYSPKVMLTCQANTVSWGPASEWATKNNIRVIRWVSGYEYVQTNEQIHMQEIKLDHNGHIPTNWIGQEGAWEIQSKTPMTTMEKKYLKMYLKNRMRGYYEEVTETILAQKLARRKDERLRVGIFPNVEGDPEWGFYAETGFAGVVDWLQRSLLVMASIEDVEWCVKPHWADYGLGDERSAMYKACAAIGGLPKNIKAIDIKKTDMDSFDVYQFIKSLDVAVIFVGTLGIESPLLGVPVLLAGNAHYCGKGFTVDALGSEVFLKQLQNIKDISCITMKQVELAKRYSASYFLKSQIPLSMIHKRRTGDCEVFLKPDFLESLKPGGDPYIDLIIREINGNGNFSLTTDLLDPEYFMESFQA